MVLASLEKEDGTSVPLSNVTVLVGPNNAGKTRSLKDIQTMMSQPRRNQGIIFNDISFETPSSLDEFTRGLSIREDPENSQYAFSGTDQNATVSFSQWQQWENSFEENIESVINTLSRTKFSFLDAGSRLRTASSQRLEGNRHNPRSTLASLFYGSRDTIDELRSAFQQAFGEDILLDYSAGSQIRFQVSDNYSDIPEHPTDLGEYIDDTNSTRLGNQGDGYLSFVGVVMNILVSSGKVVLLDEPDAFLHPPQARMLGNWIAERAETTPGQVVIATHDSDFLFGILEHSSNVNIFRLNRPDQSTQFHIIPSRITNSMAEDHLLSSQRVLRAVFHEGVVVCEGGKDRVVYQSVASEILDENDLLFVDALGWKVIKRITGALGAASIPVAAIADLDVLNERDEFKRLLLSFQKAAAYEEIEHLIEMRNSVASSVSSNGGWDPVKDDGVSGFPDHVQDDVRELINEAEEYGLFLVNAGELESWMEPESDNDPWSIAALDAIADRNMDILDDTRNDPNIVDFVSKTCEFVQTEYSSLLN